MSYSKVHLVNSTPYGANGTVSYRSAFCSDDQYSAGANGGTWEASSRGVCLLTKISANLAVGNTTVAATPYESSGTAYSQFAIVQLGPDSFAVTRLTGASDSVDVGELQPEPTTQQK